MKRETGTSLKTGDVDPIASALLAQQVMTHRSNTPYAIFGAAITAFFLLALEWDAVSSVVLLTWFAGVACVLALRLAARMVHVRRVPDPVADVATNRAWLRRYRFGFLAHGIVWGLAGLMPLARGDTLHLAILIVMLACITASSFTLTAYDLWAALLFGAPVLGLLSVRLFSQSDSAFWTLGVASIAALGFLTLTARRAQRVVHNYVALRVATGAQAEALRSSEELLERTGATAGVGGWEIDPVTGSIRLTAQIYRIHEVSPTSRPGFEDLVQLYGPEQQVSIRTAIDAALTQGTPFDLELPLVTVGGTHRWVRVIGEARLRPGKPPRLSGVVQDITHAKAAELALAEKHHLLTLLVETTREGIWFIDNDTLTTDVNPAMCEILGRPREDIVGRSIFTFVDAANTAIFHEQVVRRAQGAIGSYQIALTRADGTQVDCFNNATPIFDADGHRAGAIGLFADISEQKRAEKVLRTTSEELVKKTQALQVTLDSIAQGIVSTDAAGHPLVYNRRALELLDLPESLLAPEPGYDEVVRFQIQRGDLAPDGGFIDADGQRQFFKSGRANSPEVYVRETRKGTLVEVRTRQLPGGGLVRTFADVTAYIEAQRGLRESEAEVRALLDAFPGFIAVLDAALSYVYVNERFAALISKRREEIVGRPVREVLGDEGANRFANSAALLRLGEPLTFESEYEATAHRARTWLQVTHSVGAGHGTGGQRIYAFGIDITSSKAAEADLIAAKDEAERANRAKSQFLSSMSHELRTPMNAILGFGQLLASDPSFPLAERQRDHVREILRGGRHLLSLINEVLDLALVETGRLQVSLESVSVATLLQECLALMLPLARPADITLQEMDVRDCACHVLADRTRLKQVLLNLLSNAIKYNRPNGQVAIACSTDGDAVRIGVVDSGNGLNPAQAERLFHAFERLGAEQTAVEGAGLGLALSKRLMQAMGGEIGLESEMGKGSTFWIRLPRAGAPGSAAVALPSASMSLVTIAASPGLRKVLYIEDNPVNVLIMEAMLDRIPVVKLIVAPLPELGLQLAADERPELILLDIQLPGMDGFEVLRRLRSQDTTRLIPVIAVSANAMAGDLERGEAAGFARYLTKPLDMRQLLDAVEAVLAAR